MTLIFPPMGSLKVGAWLHSRTRLIAPELSFKEDPAVLDFAITRPGDGAQNQRPLPMHELRGCPAALNKAGFLSRHDPHDRQWYFWDSLSGRAEGEDTSGRCLPRSYPAPQVIHTLRATMDVFQLSLIKSSAHIKR